MNYTEMLFNRDERLVNLLNQADSKNLELIEEINNREDEIEKLTAESTKWESKFYDEAKKVDKAIEYLKLFDDNSSLIDHSIIKGALNLLEGNDK